MRARTIALLVAMVAVGTPVHGIDHEIQSWTLEPGTEVVLVEDHRVPLVHVTIEFPVGHWSPWATRQHAEEAFDVQPYDPDGALRSRADELSVDLSVSMGTHASSVSVSCLREDVESVLELVREVLQYRDFDKRELKRWTKSEKLEWSGSQKLPQFKLEQTAARMLYREDDPRRRGSEKPVPYETDVEHLAATRDVVIALPGRVIGVAGDVTRAEADRFATGLLPPVLDAPPDGLEPQLGPLTPMDELPSERTVTMTRIQQTFFGYGRHSLTYDDPGYAAFLVADHVLGGHFFSRMYKALRHEGGETYGAGTTGRGGTYREPYALLTFTRGENTEVAEQKLREVLRRLHEDGITEGERQAAVGFMLGRRAFSRQSPSQILSRFLWERRHGLPAGFYDDLVERAAHVPLPEINTFIADFYDPENFAMVKVTPR